MAHRDLNWRAQKPRSLTVGRFRTRMGRLALNKGEGEGEGLVERTFILYDPSPPSSPL